MNPSVILRPLALIAVVAVIVAALYLVLKPGEPAPVIGEHESAIPVLQGYEHTAFGLAFWYPETYVLEEHDAPTSERIHHTVVLTDVTAAANIPENGEGPTTITLDIFGNDIDKLPVDRWIKNTSASNFKLSTDQVLATTTVAGAPALRYTWDGLYRGESVVLAHNGTILLFTVTYMDSTDRIRADFEELLKSVRLD